VKGTKSQTSKNEGRKSKNPDTTGSMRSVFQRKFRSTWGERMQKNTEKKERENYHQRSGKIKSKRKMEECRAD
jgi:hypothetical protein